MYAHSMLTCYYVTGR